MTSVNMSARFAVGFFGFIALGGLIWFGASLTAIMLGAGMILVLSSAVVVAIPERGLESRAGRLAIILSCMLGILSLMTMSAYELIRSQTIEWDVEVMRALHLVAFGLIAIYALKKASSPKPVPRQSTAMPGPNSR